MDQDEFESAIQLMDPKLDIPSKVSSLFKLLDVDGCETLVICIGCAALGDWQLNGWTCFVLSAILQGWFSDGERDMHGSLTTV